MSSVKHENIVESKKCAISGQEFVITDHDLEFYDTISPIFGDKKYPIPTPTLCPDERHRRRTSWRNDRNFYSRKCSATGKKLISSFSPESPFPLYEHKYWWSDAWSAFDFGRAVDFGRPFFDQFIDLQTLVPQIPMINDNGSGSENCEYCYDFAFGKDCYFSMGMWQARDCLYCTLCDYGDRAVDCEHVVKPQLSYECMYSRDIQECAYLEASINCARCWFGMDLIGCRDCFMCAGLRQKQYCILNVQYTKEEYERRRSEVSTGSSSQLAKLLHRWEEFVSDFPRRPVFQVQTEESTGDMLFNCFEVRESHCIYDARECKYFMRGDSPKNSYDIFNSGKPEYSYEGLTPDNSYGALFTTWCWKCRNILYSDNCHSSADLFGCIALRNKKHCILNTSYSTSEYEKLAGKLIDHMKSTGEWGEFFPIEKSPFPYDDSVAQDYFPLTKKEILSRGLRFSNKDHAGAHVKQTYVVADNIEDVSVEICHEALVCPDSGKAFKIQKNELGVYKAMDIPIPKLHPSVRRSKRLQKRNSHKLYDRTCAKSGERIQTIYAPDRPEKVYSEKCYQEFISQFN